MRREFLRLIEREIAHRQDKKPARIIIKVNSLTDVELIHELYRASQAGVEVDLIVRGICMLRPGIEGLSENIRVRSIVGRFLEHSRIFYFANGGDQEEIYMGSADWMRRNIDRRVEVVAPVKDENIRQYIRDSILGAYLRDTVNAQILQADGTYQKISGEDSELFDSQMNFVGQNIKI
jgi:polyphosphate kinase